MTKKILLIIAVLCILGSGFVFAMFGVYNSATVKISTEIRNVSTGKLLQEKSTVHEGDILERSVFVEDPSISEAKDIVIHDINPFTNELEQKTLRINPGKISILSQKIPVTKDLKNIPAPSQSVFIPENIKLAFQKVFPFLEGKIPQTEVVRTFSSSGNSVTEASSLPSSGNTAGTGSSGIEITVESRPQTTLNFWEITSLNTMSIDNNFDVFFEIQGNHLNTISKLVFQCPTKAVFVPVSVIQEHLLQTTLAAFSLENGDCQLGVDVNNVAYFSDKMLHVHQSQTQNAEVLLKSIVPNFGGVNKDSLLILQGKGFDKVVLVQIDNGVVLDLQFLQKISDTTMVVNVPKGLQVGDYSFRFLTKNSVLSFPNITFKLSQE